jgi:hypothetical protein
VIHIVCATLFGAPVANVGKQRANLFGKWAVASNSVGAQAANRRAFNATRRTGIDAFLAYHVRKTDAAFGGTQVAAVDAVFCFLIQITAHGDLPLGDWLMEIHGGCQTTASRIMFRIE